MKKITPKEYIDADKSNAVIIDVRTEEEYVRRHIEGAVNIPLDVLVDNIEKVVLDKQKTIFIYCMSGSRSAAAARILDDLGYTNVNEIQNGILGLNLVGMKFVE